MKHMDILVVGCGFSGSVIARRLAELGKKVVIWERRDHIAGNMYDYFDEHGILVHKYGPHIFHTTQKHLYDYICKYGEWENYHLTCMAQIDGVFTPTPFNFQTIDDFFIPEKAQEIKAHISKVFPGKSKATVVEMLECEDAVVRGYAEFLFEKDYRPYTAKQWNVPPEEIDPSVLARVPVVFSYNTGYFDDPYQCMPAKGYTEFFNNLLNHDNITVRLGIDALDHLSVSREGAELLLDGKKCTIPVVYTGAIDELFGLSYGKLPYRSLRFDWHYDADIDSYQPAPVVAYPQQDGFTRITEYKKLPVQNAKGTSYAVEYPLSYQPGQDLEPYYPIPTQETHKQFAIYRENAARIKNLFCCGRLAEYRYYNMDQALSRALEMLAEIEKAVL